MTIRAFGALLCGGVLMLVTSTGGYAAEDKEKKDTKAGAAIFSSASNIKAAPECKKAGGVWNKTTKTCAAHP